MSNYLSQYPEEFSDENGPGFDTGGYGTARPMAPTTFEQGFAAVPDTHLDAEGLRLTGHWMLTRSVVPSNAIIDLDTAAKPLEQTLFKELPGHGDHQVNSTDI